MLRKSIVLFIVLALFDATVKCSAQGKAFSSDFVDFNLVQEVFQQDSIPRFHGNSDNGRLLLSFGYAGSKISEAFETSFDTFLYKVTAINMIVSNYPKDKEKWINSFSELTSQRLQELFKIAPFLNNSSIKYTLVWQTDCKNEDDAKKMFHGFEIIYELKDILLNENNSQRSLYDSIEILKAAEYSADNNCEVVFVLTTSFADYDNMLWLCNSELGVFSTNDYGANIKSRNKGLRDTAGVRSLCVFKGQLYCSTSTGGIFTFNKTNNTWSAVKGVDSGMAIELKTNGHVMVTNIKERGLFLTKDGKTWKNIKVNTTIGGKTELGTIVGGAANFFFRDDVLFLANGKKLFVTTNYGDTWVQIKLPFEHDIYSINCLGGDDSLLFIGAYVNGIYCSSNNGRTWTKVNSQTESKINSIYSGENYLLMSSSNSTTGLLAFKEGEWHAIANIIGYSIFRYQDYIFVGSNNGLIYRFKDNSIIAAMKESLD